MMNKKKEFLNGKKNLAFNTKNYTVEKVRFSRKLFQLPFTENL